VRLRKMALCPCSAQSNSRTQIFSLVIDYVRWSVKGYPFKYGGEKCFSIVISLFGTYIAMDEETKKMERLDRAKILMKVTFSLPIAICYNVKINGNLHRVRVVEEAKTQVN